jgi:thiol-disulfide isomerase/thioredoxin
LKSARSRHYLNLLFAAILVMTALTGLFQSGIAQSLNTPTIYFFWGEGCQRCEDEKLFLQELKTRYPDIQVLDYEVRENPDNKDILFQKAAALGFEPGNVPVTIIGRSWWIGFNELVAAQMESVLSSTNTLNPPVFQGSQAESSCSIEESIACETPEPEIINIPLIGEVDLNSQSLTLSTALIAFVDGVNPCSVWVLTMLLALTINMGSRKKIVIIGLIFLTVTAGIYALFIFGIFSVFSFVGYIGWIRILVALLALFFGAINIKDYFWYKEGLSLTISDKDKPGIFRKMRRVMDLSENFWAMAGATVALAAGVSLVEFSCTAGFPVIWTNMLITHDATTLTFALLLMLYLIIYQADEMVIFFTAVVSMKASKLGEKHGRILKLIGGMLMVTLAVVMLVNPAWMNDLSSSLVVFGVAMGATLLVLLVHRTILPRFGIHIGTELNSKKKKG